MRPKLRREIFFLAFLTLLLIVGKVLGQRKSAYIEPQLLSEVVSQEKPQKSNEISPEVMNAINEMSRSVGGTGYVLGLGWVDLANGRELQMTVRDNTGRRWRLGVDQVSAKPATKFCFAADGSLGVADDKAEPNYGMVNAQPIKGVVGRAINRELLKLRDESKPAARISEIKAVISQGVIFVVSWESEPTSAKGTFAIDKEGKTTSPPPKQ